MNDKALPNPFESVVLPTMDGPVAAALHPLSGAAAGSPIPAGYVLVERTVLEGLAIAIARIKAERKADVPAFLANPSWEYLEAVRA